MPATRPEFWATKIAANRDRDEAAREKLRHEGWRTLDVWECALKGRQRLSPEMLAEELMGFISGTCVKDDIAGNPANGSQVIADGIA